MEVRPWVTFPSRGNADSLSVKWMCLIHWTFELFLSQCSLMRNAVSVLKLKESIPVNEIRRLIIYVRQLTIDTFV